VYADVCVCVCVCVRVRVRACACVCFLSLLVTYRICGHETSTVPRQKQTSASRYECGCVLARLEPGASEVQTTG